MSLEELPCDSDPTLLARCCLMFHVTSLLPSEGLGDARCGMSICLGLAPQSFDMGNQEMPPRLAEVRAPMSSCLCLLMRDTCDTRGDARLGAGQLLHMDNTDMSIC